MTSDDDIKLTWKTVTFTSLMNAHQIFVLSKNTAQRKKKPKIYFHTEATANSIGMEYNMIWYLDCGKICRRFALQGIHLIRTDGNQAKRNKVGHCFGVVNEIKLAQIERIRLLNSVLLVIFGFVQCDDFFLCRFVGNEANGSVAVEAMPLFDCVMLSFDVNTVANINAPE